MHAPSSGCRYGDIPPAALSAPFFFTIRCVRGTVRVEGGSSEPQAALAAIDAVLSPAAAQWVALSSPAGMYLTGAWHHCVCSQMKETPLSVDNQAAPFEPRQREDVCVKSWVSC